MSKSNIQKPPKQNKTKEGFNIGKKGFSFSTSTNAPIKSEKEEYEIVFIPKYKKNQSPKKES